MFLKNFIAIDFPHKLAFMKLYEIVFFYYCMLLSFTFNKMNWQLTINNPIFCLKHFWFRKPLCWYNILVLPAYIRQSLWNIKLSKKSKVPNTGSPGTPLIMVPMKQKTKIDKTKYVCEIRVKLFYLKNQHTSLCLIRFYDGVKSLWKSIEIILVCFSVIVQFKILLGKWDKCICEWQQIWLPDW